MNLRKRTILMILLLVVLSVLLAGCGVQKTPYENNNAQGYTVSVKFDAGSGVFTTNTSVITDSYNISALTPNSSGQVEIPLLAPDDENRGKDAFKNIANKGYFLAGWYAKRTETLDENGNAVYVYGDKWDFETDRLQVDPNGTYTAEEPVLTLYAAWVPEFQVELYDRATGEFVDSFSLDVSKTTEVVLPAWSEATGAQELSDFPERTGYTYGTVYYDAEGTQPVNTASITHPGQVDETNGVAKNGVLKLYVDWREGQWYRIYTAQQLADNANVSGCYEIYADLDFTDVIWPTSLMYGSFSGTIEGNGHTFRNITLTQTNNSKVNAGLFGQLAETAQISDLHLENVTFTIQSGTRVTGTAYGLLAGTVSDQAQITGVSIADSCLLIDSGAYFGTDDYVIGLVCGVGAADVDPSGIACEATGDSPEKVTVTVNDGIVSVEINP